MIYEICNFLLSLSEGLSFFRLVNYISFRAIMAALTAVIFIFLFSRHFILFVHRHCFLDQVRETGVHSAFDKSGTPTMGGVLIIGAVLVSMAIWGNWRNPFMLCSVAGMVWFGLLGLWDDVSKVRLKSGDRGISERAKLFLQGFFSLVFAWICVGPYAPLGSALATKVCVPFYKYPLIDIGPWLYGLFIFLFVIFVSNAVNITDGLDATALPFDLIHFSADIVIAQIYHGDLAQLVQFRNVSRAFYAETIHRFIVSRMEPLSPQAP